MVSSTQPPIGVAIVGTGFGQKVHIPGLQAHPRTQIVAVYHRNRAKAAAIAQQYQIPHACQTIEEIVSQPDVQAVSISTPPFLHYEQATIVLNAGKHLLLEKPTTLTATEAATVQQLAMAKGVVANLNFEFRCIPTWLRLAELLAEGYVGKPRLIKVDWLVSSRADASRPWNWYAQKALGGGALGAIGSHAFDYITWLFGDVKQLCARLSVSVSARPDPESGQLKPVDADDVCTILLELADGTPCQMCLSAAAYQGRGHWLEVYGDRGTLVLGSDNQNDYVHGFKLWGSPLGEPLKELEIPKRLEFAETFQDGRIAPFIRIVDRWVQGIETGAAIAPSLEDGLKAQQLMARAHESHQSGQWVIV